MPNRYSQKMHETLYRFIAARDGECCIDPSCRRGPDKAKLQIDHADNEPTNWRPENLHLLCQRHNLAMNRLTTAEHMHLMREYSDVRARERARDRGLPHTPEVRRLVDMRSGSIEVQLNSHYWPVFKDYVLDSIRKEGQVEKEDLVLCACLAAHANPLTGKRYLKLLTCSDGPLVEAKDGFGNIVIKFRDSRPKVIRATHGGKGVDEGVAGQEAIRSRTTVRSIRASAGNAGGKEGKTQHG